jgi:hypothetical protein
MWLAGDDPWSVSFARYADKGHPVGENLVLKQNVDFAIRSTCA